MAKKICDWALGVSDAYLAYHDLEWGVPVRDDRDQFEFLVLESAQAGLSWSTVLHKRDGYRKAFLDFDVQKVARFSEKKILKLIEDPNIIRNKLKIRSAVSNAKCFLQIQTEFGSFSEYIWGFVNGKPIQNKWRTMSEVPATTKESDELSRDLKQRGFKFVGSTIMYAHMQATGLVNDHIIGCPRRAACRKLA